MLTPTSDVKPIRLSLSINSFFNGMTSLFLGYSVRLANRWATGFFFPCSRYLTYHAPWDLNRLPCWVLITWFLHFVETQPCVVVCCIQHGGQAKRSVRENPSDSADASLA